MVNKLQLEVKQDTPLTKHLKAIIEGAEKKESWITLSDFAGYVRLFQCYYDPIINVKLNEDDEFYHLSFVEDKKFVAAIKSAKDENKQNTCLPVHQYLKAS